MDNETEVKMNYLARQVAAELLRQGGPNMLPGAPTATRFPACGIGVPSNGCEGLTFAPITILRFLRGGRTLMEVIEEGKIPVAPGSSVVLTQRPHPAWPTGCYVLRYRLANNGQNHDEVKIEWFIDDEPLDAVQYGSELYNIDGKLIGEGKLPVPLAAGEHCCIGSNNRLRVRITHTGNANAIENIRLHVEHAGAVACCSSCAVGKGCQRGCHGAQK